MIERYFIDCELYRQTTTQDDMNVDVLTYAKFADITGVIIQRSTRQLLGEVYHVKNTPIFLTKAAIQRYDRVVYKGLTYEVAGDPNDVMERGHHYEVNLEAVI